MNVAPLMPVKGFRNAKQRLNPLLKQRGARAPCGKIRFRDVSRQARLARGLADIRGYGRRPRRGHRLDGRGGSDSRKIGNGETGAVDFARKELKSAGCEAVLIMPGDIRAAQRRRVDLAQVPRYARAPFALLVPSHDRLGTNALLLAPPDVIELRFGYDSFAFYEPRGSEGLPVRFFENERIALDIDEPKDLERFLSYGFEDSEAARVARQLLAEPHTGQSPRSGDA